MTAQTLWTHDEPLIQISSSWHRLELECPCFSPASHELVGSHLDMRPQSASTIDLYHIYSTRDMAPSVSSCCRFLTPFTLTCMFCKSYPKTIERPQCESRPATVLKLAKPKSAGLIQQQWCVVPTSHSLNYRQSMAKGVASQVDFRFVNMNSLKIIVVEYVLYVFSMWIYIR